VTTDQLRLATEGERDPIRELHELLMGDSAAGRLRMPSELTWAPPTDVVETNDEIVIVIDIAGMDGKDISVVTDGATLRVRGTRRGPAASGIKHFHQIEIRSGPFERAVELPSRVDPGKVSAQYTKGLLEVRVRKLPASESVKRVKIL
jgi:HSP20 family molecular chaperone IbpA